MLLLYIQQSQLIGIHVRARKGWARARELIHCRSCMYVHMYITYVIVISRLTPEFYLQYMDTHSTYIGSFSSHHNENQLPGHHM